MISARETASDSTGTRAASKKRCITTWFFARAVAFASRATSTRSTITLPLQMTVLTFISPKISFMVIPPIPLAHRLTGTQCSEGGTRAAHRRATTTLKRTTMPPTAISTPYRTPMIKRVTAG